MSTSIAETIIGLKSLNTDIEVILENKKTELVKYAFSTTASFSLVLLVLHPRLFRKIKLAG